VLAAARGAADTAAAESACAPAIALLEFDDALDGVLDELRQVRRDPDVDLPSAGTPTQRGVDLAGAIRSRLGLGFAPIADLPALISELTGVDVGSADLGGASGVCVADPERETALVLVNNTHSPERQRFTYAHEFGHLLFGDGTHVDGLASGRGSKEVRADSFAAALLIPVEALRAWLSATQAVTRREQVTERVMALAARHFGVSPEVTRIAFERAKLLPASMTTLPTARVLASRYGWARQYGAEVELARRGVQPQRIVERATRAYRAGRLGVSALAALTGADTDVLAAELSAADVAPAPEPPRANVTDLLARAAARQ
jgi:Zn-dependent peptidase ImmA (M78 family)